jgi:hypothetical protein
MFKNKILIMIVSFSMFLGIGMGVTYAINKDIENSSGLTKNTPKEKFKPVSAKFKKWKETNIPHEKDVLISLSDEEKISLYKQGFTLEEIHWAVLYANEKNQNDAEKILKDQRTDLQDFITEVSSTKIPIENQSTELQLEEVKHWEKQGFKKTDIEWAYSLSRKYHQPLDVMLKKVQNGEIGYYITQKDEEGRENVE